MTFPEGNFLRSLLCHMYMKLLSEKIFKDLFLNNFVNVLLLFFAYHLDLDDNCLVSVILLSNHCQKCFC